MMYKKAAIPATLLSISSAFITLMLSPAVWWYLKQYSWSSVSLMEFLKHGTPLSQSGPVSTISPSGSQKDASRIDMQFFRTPFTISAPLPLCPIPTRRVLPSSLSKAATCLSIYLSWVVMYWAAPSMGLPCSSPLQAMNLIVLLGLKLFSFNNLKASKTVTNPPPSSLAPVCDPVSQLSMCPPANTIWSGNSLPLISKTKLLLQQPLTSLFSRFSSTTIFCPLSCILENISASSTVMAAAGILG